MYGFNVQLKNERFGWGTRGQRQAATGRRFRWREAGVDVLRSVPRGAAALVAHGQ